MWFLGFIDNIMQTEQFVFRNVCVYTYIQAKIISKERGCEL